MQAELRGRLHEMANKLSKHGRRSVDLFSAFQVIYNKSALPGARLGRYLEVLLQIWWHTPIAIEDVEQ